MNTNVRVRLAIQKKGRLNHDSIDLLQRCGVKFRLDQSSLYCRAENLNLDLLFVRDDDIPDLIRNNVCDLGIVGENVLLEQHLEVNNGNNNDDLDHSFEIIKKLGYGQYRLCISLPKEKNYVDHSALNNLRIATSYPNLVRQYLNQHGISAEIISISGSVKIAPRLGMADAICDLVSTGKTLEENNLKEVAEVIHSQAVLIKSTAQLEPEKNDLIQLLLRRMNGVLKALESKYIMFHVPRTALSAIKRLLPGTESPTILPLEGMENKVAVHVVAYEQVFWETVEQLKQAGASSILVIPIEKMLA